MVLHGRVSELFAIVDMPPNDMWSRTHEDYVCLRDDGVFHTAWGAHQMNFKVMDGLIVNGLQYG